MPKPSLPITSIDEIVSLNDDDLMVDTLEARLELALITILTNEAPGNSCDCHCPRLRICDVFCPRPPV